MRPARYFSIIQLSNSRAVLPMLLSLSSSRLFSVLLSLRLFHRTDILISAFPYRIIEEMGCQSAAVSCFLPYFPCFFPKGLV